MLAITSSIDLLLYKYAAVTRSLNTRQNSELKRALRKTWIDIPWLATLVPASTYGIDTHERGDYDDRPPSKMLGKT